MKENRRGFDGTNFEAPSHRARVNPLATEEVVTRAIQAVTNAARNAGKRAHAAGVTISGRIGGKRVKVAPDGKVTELSKSS